MSNLVILTLSDIEQISFTNDSNEIELNSISSMINLDGLVTISHIEKVAIRNCPNLKDISAVSQFKYLIYLTIENCTKITDLSPINAIHKLVRLNCIGFPDLEILNSLKDNTAIKQLDLLQDRQWFTGFLETNTVSLYIYFKADKVIDLKPIELLQNVHNIGFHYCSSLVNIDSLLCHPNISQLVFYICNNLINIDNVTKLKNLKHCKFYECEKIESVDSVLKIKNLMALYLEDCTKIKELNFKKGNSIHTLELHSLPLLKKLNNLIYLQHVKQFIFEDCNSYNNINDFSLLTNIEELGFFSNKEIIHFDYSNTFKNLKKINIWTPSLRTNKSL